MDDVQQMLVNELNRLERAINNRTKVIEKLEAKEKKVSLPKRYVLEFQFTPSASRLPPQSRSFVVDRDSSRFVCQQIVPTVAVAGTRVGTATASKLTISPEGTGTLRYACSFRDTSTDREWQNYPISYYHLTGGFVSGLVLPYPAVLQSGSEIEVTVSSVSLYAFISGFTSVSSVTLQLSFVGFEVV